MKPHLVLLRGAVETCTVYHCMADFMEDNPQGELYIHVVASMLNHGGTPWVMTCTSIESALQQIESFYRQTQPATFAESLWPRYVMPCAWDDQRAVDELTLAFLDAVRDRLNMSPYMSLEFAMTPQPRPKVEWHKNLKPQGSELCKSIDEHPARKAPPGWPTESSLYKGHPK